MKLEIYIGLLKAYFPLLNALIPQKTTMPSLTGFRLEAGPEWATISATDLEKSIIIRIPADVKEIGEMVIPAKTFMNWLSATDGDPKVTLTSEPKNKLKATVGASEAKFSCFVAEDYPIVKVMDDISLRLQIPSDVFGHMIKGVAFATNDEIKLSFKNGVFFNLAEKVLAIAATDSYRVCEAVCAVESTDVAHALIPADSALLAAMIDGGAAQPLTIGFSKDRIGFSCGNVEIGSLTMAMDFPNYRAIIPQSSPIIYMVSQRALVSALQRLSFLSDSNQLSVSFIKDNTGASWLNLKVDSSETGNGEDVIEVKTEPGKDAPIAISINLQYLKDSSKFCGDTIEIGLRGIGRQVTVTSPEKTGWISVIMPFVSKQSQEAAKEAEKAAEKRNTEYV